MIATRPKLAVILSVVATLLPACAVNGLGFSNDHRVKIVSPKNRAKVELPLTIRWTAPGLKRSPTTGPLFVVFLDRAPIRPGQTLRALADDACKRTPGCPDLAYLREQNVFVTNDTSLRLEVVPKQRGLRTGAKESHEATIILVDDDGRRMGEAAYTVAFSVTLE